MARKPSVRELAELRAKLRGSSKDYRPYSFRVHSSLLVEVTSRAKQLDVSMLEVFEEALLDWLEKRATKRNTPV